MIRRAHKADCPAILDVMFSTAMSKKSSWWKNSVGSLEARLAEGGGFVAEEDGVLVGCVMHLVDGGGLVLRGLAVRPDCENRGIGKALVRAVEDEARRLELPRVLLAVSSANLEVCPYYVAMGYQESDKPYAHGAPGRPAPKVFTKAM